jgi:hypothetical protein
MRLSSAAFLAIAAASAHAAPDPYRPAWADIPPKRTIPFSGDARALVQAIASLQPGDHLAIASGTYSIDHFWDITISGTRTLPITIAPARDATVVLTRADARQNTVNLGQSRAVAFVCLRGLEITHGSHGLRIGAASDVWIDQCHIHHTGDVCLSANSHDTSRLFLTGNHLHHGAGHAEGMYLGANDGKFVMSESVIARNHVHDCFGDQGDGIEVKQGSWGNLIAENHIHDTNYPCITVYGTGGRKPNIIERNLCHRSRDHVMQVQGEAIVRNNVLIAGQNAGFASTDHQGKTKDLTVVHNTIVSSSHAFRGNSWNDRPGLVLANNVLYSRDGHALFFPSGHKGATITGNVIAGSGPDAGSHRGRSLADDFPGISWDGSRHDASPARDAPLRTADPRFLEATDFLGSPRSQPMAGAIATAGDAAPR